MTPVKLAFTSIFIAIFPLLVAGLATLVAHVLGCALNEAEAEKCIFCGADISQVLYAMFLFGWLGMLTIGIGAAGLLASAVWGLLKWFNIIQ